MPFLVWSTIICCVSTAALARGSFELSVVLFIIANASYQAGLQFYDALLPEGSTPENRGRISGLGVGLGYLGSYIAVGIGFLIAPDERALLFTIIAVTFMLFALPCFLFVGERGNPNPKPVWKWSAVRESTAETIAALKSSQEFPRFDDLASHPSLRAFFVGQRKYSGHFAAPEFCERIPSLRRRKIANIQTPDNLGHSCDEFGSAPKKSCMERAARKAVDLRRSCLST
jgi:MFS-type transporter involved in bile tolerance (Atg22 family)